MYHAAIDRRSQTVMSSQPPQPPRYPAQPMQPPPTQIPAHLAHVVNPQYTLTAAPQHLPLSLPGLGMPLQPVAHAHSHMSGHHGAHVHPHAIATSSGASAPSAMHAPAPVPAGCFDSYAGASVARLKSELEKAHAEIERLRAKLAEYEKERAKAESPKVQSRYWTPSEHKRFLEALQKYGAKDVRAIATYVGSRNATQVRTHAQKYFLRKAREARVDNALQSSRKRSMSESDLARVGRSVRTPPGSPVMREGKQAPPLFPQTCLAPDVHMTNASGSSLLASLPPTQSEHVAQGPVLPPAQQQAIVQRQPFSGAMTADTMKSGAATAGPTAGKPPVAAGKLSDTTGINLLSMVASERKMESEKIAR